MIKMTFYCPFCKKPLRKGKDEYYQTLVEHCTDPNEEENTIKPRETWKCNCCFSLGCFWSFEGELFTKWDLPKGNRELIRKTKFTSCLGSVWRKIDEEIYREKRK
jgi:hypothetical protein